MLCTEKNNSIMLLTLSGVGTLVFSSMLPSNVKWQGNPILDFLQILSYFSDFLSNYLK